MKRLPTKTEFKALLKLPRKWDEKRKGLLVTASNGNKLFLPAFGEYYDTDVSYAGHCGYYWSATQYENYYSWYFFFSSYGENVCSNDCNRGLSVRFISDKPCDGFVDMGIGIYWSSENYQEVDKMYFTWNEAIEIQDKVNGTATEEHMLTISDSLPIDWEQRRYEIAKAALAGLLANPSFSGTAGIAKRAVKYADDMIKQLKQ